METIKDIVAEMRKDMPRVVDAKVILRNYADRIEKAVTNCNQLKMREALLKADVLISIATFEEGVKMDEVGKMRSEIKAALAESLRNCDVGTAEEQADRFEAYCDSHTNCAHCPLAGQQCVLAWSQMPYESEVKQ